MSPAESLKAQIAAAAALSPEEAVHGTHRLTVEGVSIAVGDALKIAGCVNDGPFLGAAPGTLRLTTLSGGSRIDTLDIDYRPGGWDPAELAAVDGRAATPAVPFDFLGPEPCEGIVTGNGTVATGGD